jgi:hypothetical protein
MRCAVRLRVTFTLCLCLGVAACETDSDASPDTSDSGSPDGGAAPEAYLGLIPPEHGFQLRSVGVDLAPGEEREYCEVVRLPGDPSDEYLVGRMELANGPYSHHLGLAVAVPGSPGEAELAAFGEGQRVECPGPGLVFGEGVQLITTIQSRYGESRLPAGVARRHRGGDLVVFDYHYANASEQSVHTESAANFHLIDAADVEHEVVGFGLNDTTIDIAPASSGTVTGECHVRTDMVVGALTRHTHNWGKDVSVWFSGGERDGELIWTSRDWEHDTEFEFPEPVLLRAGEGLRYRCDFVNDTEERLRFGVNVDNEMCMVYGPSWPAVPGTDLGETYCNTVWTDDEGINHPADEAGGFPAPSAAEVHLCTAAFGAALDECASCSCDACATPAFECLADPDCVPLYTCFAACTDLACARDCQAQVRLHSEGSGPFMAAAECLRVECPGCLPVE